MFGKGKRPHKISSITTIIGRGTRIVGDVHFHGGLHVDGAIEGSVCAEEDAGSVLIVSEEGSIQGKVQVPSVVLNGSVTGDIHASRRIELASRARVNGNVYYHLLEMERGAEVNGNLVRESGEPAMLGYDSGPRMLEANES